MCLEEIKNTLLEKYAKLNTKNIIPTVKQVSGNIKLWATFLQKGQDKKSVLRKG